MSEAALEQEVGRLMGLVKELKDDRDYWRRQANEAFDLLNKIEDLLK